MFCQYFVGTMKLFIILFPIVALSQAISSFGAQQSDDYQSHESIVAAAEEYLKKESAKHNGEISIEITPLDHRLRLNQCSDTLETFSPPGANQIGKTTVGIRCYLPHPWTVYISGNIHNFQSVVVTAKDLNRGTVINATDVKLDSRDTSILLRGHFISPDEIIGRTLRRSIHRGKVITPSSLISKKLIKRGQSITILSGNENIQVRMKGKALRNGNTGDLIPVQNLTSKKQLEARVIAEGIVKID